MCLCRLCGCLPACLCACRFPPNTGQVLLHGACSLPHLQRLVLYRCEDPPGSVLQIQDLDTLVECCPALQELALWLPARSSSVDAEGASSSSNGARGGRPSHGAPGSKQLQLAPLLALPDLTSLVVAGPGVTCAELAAVGQLRLSSLALYRCSALADPALLQLTQLNQLTVLAIDAHSCVTKWPGVSEYLYLQGPAGQQAQAPMGSADRTQGIARVSGRQHMAGVSPAPAPFDSWGILACDGRCHTQGAIIISRCLEGAIVLHTGRSRVLGSPLPYSRHVVQSSGSGAHEPAGAVCGAGHHGSEAPPAGLAAAAQAAAHWEPAG